MPPTDINSEADEFDRLIQERFKRLPKVVQDAITSADVEKRLRALAETQKLHIDQWEKLENEVQMTLLGIRPVENLEKNIKKTVAVTDEIAKSLTDEISKIVFEPIRQELERQLDNPDARPEEVSGVEAAGKEAMQAEKAPAASAEPAAPPVAPATPPAPSNADKSQRSTISESYKPTQTSVDRKDVHDDPYREAP
jgi:hypothetical protein